MRRVLWLICGVLLSFHVNAVEVAGIGMADSVKVAGADLQLNGTGVRTKFFFKVYVAGLYLVQKQSVADTVIADGQVHRVALHMMRDMSSAKLLEAFNEAIRENHTPEELSAMSVQLSMLTQIFNTVKEVKTGDLITLDYMPGAGTRISLNAVTQGVIPGPTFNRALLKIWLGNKPVQEDLKKGLLGG